MIPTHGPTVRIPDREGRINYFVLSPVPGDPISTWHTHGITAADFHGPNGSRASAAALFRRNSCDMAITVKPDQPATIPELAAMLEARCLAAGIVAEHLTGDEAWPA